MTTANPYAAPSATDFGNNTAATYEPAVFSFSGRIGRLRYLAYSLAWGLAMGLVVAVLGGVVGVMGGEGFALMAVLGLFYVGSLVPMFALAVRRLNDLDQSGWWSLVMLVPVLGFLLAIYLIFGPGTQGANRYGPAPGPNSGLVVVAGLLLPIIAIIGIVAAVAIPFYYGAALDMDGYEIEYSDY